jgi:hypothetical protein
MTTAVPTTVGDRGIDFSFANPNLEGTYKAGGRFIIRYSAGAGTEGLLRDKPNKICEPKRIRNSVAKGLDFIANSEWYESRVTEGAAAGKADGGADLAFWKTMGLARGAAIYVSWDAAPVKSKWKYVDAYFKAYRNALDGYYKVGCYAGTPYLRHAFAKKLIDYGWRPNASSWSNDKLPYQPATNTVAQRRALVTQALKATPAAIYQTGNYWWKKSADENLILRPCGSHLQALAAGAKPDAPSPKPPSQDKPHYGEEYPWALISKSREYAVILNDDGSIDVRRDGTHIRSL